MTNADNVSLLQEIESFRLLFKSIFPSAKKLFERSEEDFKRKFLFFWTFTIFFLILDKFSMTKHTVRGLIAYFLLLIPYLVNFSLLCYLHYILHFTCNCQKFINLFANEVSKQTSQKTRLQVMEKLLQLHSLLYSLKNSFATVFSSQIIFLMLHYIGEIVYLVKSS